VKLKLCNLLLLACVIFPFLTQAQTTINGGSVKGKWTKANSPYLITANISIAAGDMLTIEPGVRVMFRNKVGVYVHGSLRANGAVGDSIDFTVEPIANYHTQWDTGFYGWRGFGFFGDLPDSDTTQFSYCKFSYVNKLDTTGCMGDGYKVNFQSDSTRFVAQGLSIACFASRFIRVTNSRFFNHIGAGGVVSMNGGGVEMLNNLVHNIECKFNSLIRADFVTGFLLEDIYLSPPKVKSYVSTVQGNNFFYLKGPCFVISTKLKSNILDNKISHVKAASLLDKKLIGIGRITCDVFVDGLECSDIQDTARFSQNDAILVLWNNKISKFINVSFKDVQLYADSKDNELIGIPVIALSHIKNAILENLTFVNCNYHVPPNFILSPASAYAPVIDNLFPFSVPVQYEIHNLKIFNCNEGLSVASSNVTVKNGIIANCSGYGVIIGNDGDFRASNLAVVNNGNYGLSIATNSSSAHGFFTNSIFTGNNGDSLPQVGQIRYYGGAKLTLKNTVLQNGIAGIKYENTTNKPDTLNLFNDTVSFVNPTKGAGLGFSGANADWHLKSNCAGTSLGFNAGTSSLATSNAYFSTPFTLPLLDLDGRERFACGTVDIGPYELTEYKQGIIAAKLLDTTAACTNFALGKFIQPGVCTSPTAQFQWQVQTKGTAFFTDIVGETNATLRIATTANLTGNQYRLKIKNTECPDSLTTNSSLVEVSESPVVNLGGDVTLHGNQSVVLKTQGTFPSYLWSDNSKNATLTIKNDTILLGERLVWLEVTADNGCKVRDSILITFRKLSNIISLKKETLTLYPNPNNGLFKVNIPEKGIIKIMDLQGKLLFSLQLEEGLWEANLKHLAKGNYLLHWEGDKTIKTTRFVIE